MKKEQRLVKENTNKGEIPAADKKRVMKYIAFACVFLLTLAFQAYTLSESNHTLAEKRKELSLAQAEHDTKKVAVETKIDKSVIYSKALKYGMKKAENSQYISVIAGEENQVARRSVWYNMKEFFIGLYKNIENYFHYDESKNA